MSDFYIHKKSGESYLLVSKGTMQVEQLWSDCIIYQRALLVGTDFGLPFVISAVSFESSFERIPDLTGKWVECIKNPKGIICGINYTVGDWYQVIVSTLADDKLVLHTGFGQGLLLYAPNIGTYFNIRQPQAKNPNPKQE